MISTKNIKSSKNFDAKEAFVLIKNKWLLKASDTLFLQTVKCVGLWATLRPLSCFAKSQLELELREKVITKFDYFSTFLSSFQFFILNVFFLAESKETEFLICAFSSDQVCFNTSSFILLLGNFAQSSSDCHFLKVRRMKGNIFRGARKGSLGYFTRVKMAMIDFV